MGDGSITLVWVKGYKNPSRTDKGDGSEVEQPGHTPLFSTGYVFPFRQEWLGNRIMLVGAEKWTIKICCLLCNYQGSFVPKD